MQKVTKEQIEYLQTLCDNLQKSWYSIEDKKGFVLQAAQSLKDIDYFSLFYQNISNIKKEYKTSFDFNEPRTILESAINHYKTQIIETSKEQYKPFQQPTIIEKPKVTEQPKPTEKQHIVTQIKPDLEKIKLESENIKLKSTEKKRLKLIAKVIFIVISFAIPTFCWGYFIKNLINYDKFDISAPLTWVDQTKFSSLEFPIILLEVFIMSFFTWFNNKYNSDFQNWFYERYKTKNI